VRRVRLLACCCFAYLVSAWASPDPPLPWERSSFSVRLESGPIEFEMECPRGRLTKLSARRSAHVVEVPMDRLDDLALPATCSGVSTRAARESEASDDVIGVELTVELSREYIREELIVFFDLKSFRFTKARRLLTYAGGETQVTRVLL
jgi:hypothetical protein